MSYVQHPDRHGYTYVEPIIFYEFAHACSKLARERQLKNVFVSNGYMTPEVSPPLAPILGGINLGIKAFTGDFYKKGVQRQVTAGAGYYSAHV